MTALPPDRPLAGQHAIVTGGGTGIGATVAMELARLGARLTLIGRREDRLAATANTIGSNCAFLVADITDDAATRRAFAAAGPAQILVNNAGAAESAPFLKTDMALLDRMMAVNCHGAFRCTQAVLPAMMRENFGRIVNIASTAGVTGYAYVTAYGAAKHALVGLTRSLARELAKTGITVNAVCPGYTDTNLVTQAVDNIVAQTGRARDAAQDLLTSGNPQGRLLRPEEVAATVGFLCLPAAAAITGQALVVAGGEVMP